MCILEDLSQRNDCYVMSSTAFRSTATVYCVQFAYILPLICLCSLCSPPLIPLAAKIMIPKMRARTGTPRFHGPDTADSSSVSPFAFSNEPPLQLNITEGQKTETQEGVNHVNESAWYRRERRSVTFQYDFKLFL